VDFADTIAPDEFDSVIYALHTGSDSIAAVIN
jgi:hypothetical protein